MVGPDTPIITKGPNQVMHDLRAIQGNVLDVICIASSFPEPFYSWITPPGTNVAGRQLYISNISQHEYGRYHCKANNTMRLSSGETYQGENTTSMHVHILYTPKHPIIKYSKTNSSKQYDMPENLLFVIRNDSFTLSSSTESMPPSTYLWTGNQNIHGTIGNKLIMASIQQDAYLTCTATNVMIETFGITSTGSASSMINVIVQYPPSASVINIEKLMGGETISKQNNTAYVIEGDSVSMICEADSKPQPYIYSWSGPIDSLSFTSKLSLHNITRQHTGLYLCLANNIMIRTFGDRVEGSTTAYIEILLASKPQAPTDFRYIEELTTDSSVTLTWKPGFNGGLTQTFILEYSKINLDTIWTTMKILHSGEPVMNATLNSLTSNVVYEVTLTAMNQIGHSTSSIALNAKTKFGSATDTSLSSSMNNTPIIVGGLVGSAILIAGVFICVRILRKCNSSKCEETNQTGQVAHNQPTDSTYDEICREPNTETGTATTDSKGAFLTTSGSRYEDLEMSTLGNDAEKQYQSLNNEGMMTHILLWRQGIWLVTLFLLCKAALIESTVLRFDPPNVIVLEGNSATLTCNISNFEPGVYFISLNEQISNVYHPQGNCSVTGALTNTQEYNVRCINEDVQITILHVSRDRHGDVWTCQRIIFGTYYESHSNVTVNVPITNVRFEEVKEYIMTKENSQTNFVCVTSAGYPKASMRWYKNNTMLSHADVTTSSTTSDKYLKVVRSTLSMYLTRDDNSSQIHCAANNNGTTSFYSTKKTVSVYFGPDTPIITKSTNQVMHDLRAIEGNVLDVICTANSFPEPVYSWRTPAGTNVAGRQLYISNISRHEDGIYHCKANNTMQLSSGETFQAENTTSIRVHILYPPKHPIVKYSTTNSSKQYDLPENILFVIRNDSFTLSCTTESSPPSTYQWTGHQNIHGTTSNQLTMVSIEKDSYLTCIATNKMNETFGITSTGSASSMITVIVQYPPSASFIRIETLLDEETISKHNNTAYVIEGDSVSMICEADSIPKPYIYSWSGPIDSISSTPKLSLRNVTRQQTGLYLCLAKNSMGRTFGDSVDGSTTAYIEILHASKPQAPTDFRYIEELTTDSSVTLTWRPGFSGGLTQTFILEYRKINLDNSWTTMNVHHSGELVMNTTLKSLASDVVYEIALTARNQLGHSTPSIALNAKTKPGPAMDKSLSPSTNNIPLIVGGLVGSAFLIAGVITCVCIARKCNFSKSAETNQTDQSAYNQPPDSTYDEICREPDTEIRNAAKDSRVSFATTSDTRYEDLELSTVGNDAEKQYQSLNNEEPTNVYVNLKI